jgi:hypothetical protein
VITLIQTQIIAAVNQATSRVYATIHSLGTVTLNIITEETEINTTRQEGCIKIAGYPARQLPQQTPSKPGSGKRVSRVLSTLNYFIIQDRY